MPTNRVLPHNGIIGELIKMDIVHKHPKGEKSTDVLDGNDGGRVDLEDPRVVLKGLHTLQFFLKEASKLSEATSLGFRPRIQGESQKIFCTVPHGDGC